MKLKNLYKTLLILSLTASTYILISFVNHNQIEARWVDLSLEEERRDALKIMNKYLSVGKLSDNLDLLRIQREIVEANQTKLWFNDRIHDYFLKPVKYYTSEIEKTGAVNCGDGIILMSSGSLLNDNSFKIVKNTIDNIHDNSAVAFTLGHEMSHWKSNHKSYLSDKEAIQEENKADISSLEYSEPTLFYSYGGGLISTFNMADNKKDTRHDPPAKRYNNIANYITRASNNRIKITKNGNVKYDGKPLFNVEKSEWVPGYKNSYKNGKETYYSRERTLYVAGQIAFAIKYNVWNKDNVIVSTQSSFFGNRDDRIALAVNNPVSGGYKIIDKFNIYSDRFNEIWNAYQNGDVDFIKNCNSEEKYCLQLLTYAYRNK